MGKKQIHHTKYNVIWAFSLFAITVLGAFAITNHPSRNSGNEVLVHGAANLQINNIPAIKRKADLKISSISISEWSCLPNGERPVILQETIENIWMALAPRYLSALYNEWVHWAGSYGSTQVPVGGQNIEGNWANLLWWKKYNIKVVIMPINYDTPDFTNWPEILNYVNWSLDANQNNNSVTQMIYVNPCP